MTGPQENKLSEYQATIAVLDANATIWSEVASVSDIATKVKACVSGIQSLRQVQELDTKGITVNKAVVREQLTAITLKLINGLVGFASFTDNYTLLDEVNYTPSELEKARDTIFYDKALLIHGKARTYETELAAYLITPEDILTAETLLAEYLTAIPEKRAAVAVSKTSTYNLKLKFRECDDLLKNKLDKLIKIFQPTYPDFVNQYFTARIIIDLGRRSADQKTIIAGTVTDFETDAPITGALVTIVQTGQTYITAADGLFSVELANPGEYTVQVEKTGYQTFTEGSIQVEKGQEVTLEIDLEPNP
ncbi:MAG: carboxypeptidase-like regulatory domain-containing protein [Bacteroidales bacterium]